MTVVSTCEGPDAEAFVTVNLCRPGVLVSIAAPLATEVVDDEPAVDSVPAQLAAGEPLG